MNILQITRRESGLPAVFNRAQLAAIAVGAVISYGLISGSVLPLMMAGPAAVLSYLAAAVLAMLLMRCLSEMTADHPTPGAFGTYAEAYLGARAGFVVRAAYVIAVIGIVGTEIALLESVLAGWLAPIPPALAVTGLLLLLNLLHVAGAAAFARAEFALTALKALALIALVALTGYEAFNGTPVSGESLQTTAADIAEYLHAPSMWEAFAIAALGFIGIEVLSSAGAETRAPSSAIGLWMRRSAGIVAMLVLASVVASAWVQWHHVLPMNTPPFMYLLELAGVPGARQVFSVLMLVTIVSVLNCQIYGGSRMLFSMARAGQAPAALGRLRRGGMGLAVTATVLLAALVYGLYKLFPAEVYRVVTAFAITGLMAVWMAIFMAYAAYRRRAPIIQKRKGKTAAWLAWAGALTMAAIAMSTLGMDAFAPTLYYGLPFLMLLWIIGHALIRLRSSKCGFFTPMLAGSDRNISGVND
ncbi:amino acid permease [Achromobacter spanius]|uniref:amino acid permease n=1 Tax=Achromobacter spanius TaxID=217203 RepID=UPI0038269D09